MGFYRTVIQVEVLSHDPLPECGLAHIAYLIDEGDCSGRVQTISEDKVDGLTMARLLHAQGSDPMFLGLTADGQEAEEGKLTC